MGQETDQSTPDEFAKAARCMSEPPPPRHNVESGEYNHLLERYKALAAIEHIDNPPPLVIVESPFVGQSGANGTTKNVAIRSRLLQLLTDAELDDTLAHELRHVAQQRSNQSFDSSEGSEEDADKAAVIATGNKEATITGLNKIASEQIKEVIAKMEKCFGDLSEEQIEKLINDQKAFLKIRTNAIKNVDLLPGGQGR